MDHDPRLFSPSAARNRQIIAEAFERLCPQAARVLEIGSGSGEHGEAVLSRVPGLSWQGSDPDEAARLSTTARMRDLGQPGAIAVDTRTEGWWQSVDGDFDCVVAINVIHITSRAGFENLFRGSAAILPTGGALFLYGPYARRGEMEESNHRFDASLKERDPAWGIRDLDDEVQPLAARFALVLEHVERVPANNHVVVFRKS